jgi:hypothetical protein
MQEDRIPPVNDSSAVPEKDMIHLATRNPTRHPLGSPLLQLPSSTVAVPFGLPAAPGNLTHSFIPTPTKCQNTTEFHSLRSLRTTLQGTILRLRPRSPRRITRARVSAWWIVDQFLDPTAFGGLRGRGRVSRVRHRTGTREDRCIYPPELPCLDRAGAAMVIEGGWKLERSSLTAVHETFFFTRT